MVLDGTLWSWQVSYGSVQSLSIIYMVLYDHDHDKSEVKINMSKMTSQEWQDKSEN